MSTERLAALREWAKNVVRDVPAVHIVNTEYVPRFKRRAEQCIDRADVLAALEHAEMPQGVRVGYPPPPADDGLRAAAQECLSCIASDFGPSEVIDENQWPPERRVDLIKRTRRLLDAHPLSVANSSANSAAVTRARVDSQEWALLDACMERDIYSPEDLTAALAATIAPTLDRERAEP